MSEWDDERDYWEERGIMTQSEFDVQLENALNGFYLDYILPLEKQVRQLGGSPKTKDESKYGFYPKLINGSIKFKMDKFGIPRSLYFTNLGMLLYQAELILKSEYLTFEDAFSGNFDLSSKVKIQWLGQENLCVYMIDKLIDEKVITDRKKNICIEKIFGIKNVAQKRDAYQKNKNAEPYGKPTGFESIDKIVKKAFDDDAVLFGDLGDMDKPLVNPKPPK